MQVNGNASWSKYVEDVSMKLNAIAYMLYEKV